MSLYDLPKTGIVLVRARDQSDVGQIIFSAVRNDKNCILHHEYFEAWLKNFYSEAVADSVFVPFSAEIPIPEPKTFSNVKNVIFTDFDIFLDVFGLFITMKYLNEIRKVTRVFVICSSEVDEFKKMTSIADAIYTIGSTSNDGLSFESSTILYDKKGRLSVQDDVITMVPGGKVTVRKIKNKEDEETEVSMDSLQAVFDAGTDIKESERAARDALQLPFVASRQEDGVAIRDATRKKIRMGGQIIYEPDQADDLDDSDPDDDLNI